MTTGQIIIIAGAILGIVFMVTDCTERRIALCQAAIEKMVKQDTEEISCK